MKIIICFSILVCLMLNITKADDFVVMEKIISLDKIKSNPYTDFIQYAFWPKQEALRKKCDNRLIENDLNVFTNILKRLVRRDYLPTAEDMKMAIGIPEYSDGSDYIFVRYMTKLGVHVEIQDGRGMYILMSSPDWKNTKLDQIETFIRDVAIKALDFPQKSGIPEDPLVFASTLDIGPSRCGALMWKLEGEVPATQSNWFSQIMWWSDGARVLFAISKMSKEDYDKLLTVANRAGQKKSRKFFYRGGE